MRAVIQVVKEASVSVDSEIVSHIKNGLLIFLAVSKNDSEDKILKITDKILKLRIFGDENGKINLSVKDKEANILIVSQFTLYADCRKGNRPSFIESADHGKALYYYQKVIEELRKFQLKIATGSFREHMEVSLVNDGPTTVIIDV